VVLQRRQGLFGVLAVPGLIPLFKAGDVGPAQPDFRDEK